MCVDPSPLVFPFPLPYHVPYQGLPRKAGGWRVRRVREWRCGHCQLSVSGEWNSGRAQATGRGGDGVPSGLLPVNTVTACRVVHGVCPCTARRRLVEACLTLLSFPSPLLCQLVLPVARPVRGACVWCVSAGRWRCSLSSVLRRCLLFVSCYCYFRIMCCTRPPVSDSEFFRVSGEETCLSSV